MTTLQRPTVVATTPRVGTIVASRCPVPGACRKPIDAAIARSLKTVPIAVKSIDARTCHPHVGSLSVILDQGREHPPC